MNKRYWYLKISDESFFKNRAVQKIYRLYGSDGVLIYQQLLLQAARNQKFATLTYTGIEDDFAEEFALLVTVGQNIELTKQLFDFLLKKELCIQNGNEFYFHALEDPNLIGTFTDSAIRTREYRERKASQRDGETSQRDAIKEKELELQSDIYTDSEKEIKNETPLAFDSLADEVLKYLNQKSGNIESIAEDSRLIKEWGNKGYSFNDFKKVIDFKFEDWGNDPKMCIYMRPKTLFGEKFEAYLKQTSIKPKSKNRFNNFHQRPFDHEIYEQIERMDIRNEGNH